MLFLGSLQQALEAWDPPALRAFDTSVMRLVQWVDDGLDRLSFDGWRAADSSTTQLMRDGPPAGSAIERLPRVTVISLTPQAYQYYLEGRTPVPRDALACLLDALGVTLLRNHGAASETGGALREGVPPPGSVLGIDIDTAPAPGTEGVTLDAACRELLTGSAAGASDAPKMEDLLRALAARLSVAAILLPRPDPEDRAKRDAFVGGLCGAGRLRFANPFLLYQAHELATTYPDRRLGGDGPDPYPLLGSVMAGLWRPPPSGATPHDPFCRGVDGKVDERALAQLDAMPQLERARQTYQQYRRADVNMGLALWRVEYFDVDAPTDAVAASATLAHRRQAAAEQFAALPASDMYILSVDSGTVDDKFLVPVAPLPVPGAWVHGAVAVTEAFESPPSFLRGVRLFGLDLLRAAVFALACLLLLRLAGSTQVGPLVELSHVLVPLGVALWLLWVEFAFWVAPNARQGEWNPPTLLMAGMALDLILRGHDRAAELEARLRDEPAGRELGRNRIARALAQIGWAVCIALATAYVVHAGRADAAGLSATPLPAALALPALALALLYVALARRFAALPLPWRNPCPPDPPSPAAGPLPSFSR